MDGRENQIILIQQRCPGVIAGRIRRIECEVGQKVLSRPLAGSDLLKLDQIRPARNGIVVNSVEMRLVPKPGPFQLRRPNI